MDFVRSPKKYIVYISLETPGALVNPASCVRRVRARWAWMYRDCDPQFDTQAREPTSADVSALWGEGGPPKE